MTWKEPERPGRDFYIKSFEHYCGFIMPISWFEESQIRGEPVENGWIVSGKKLHPWYLSIPFGIRKISSEAFCFKENEKIEQARNSIEYTSSQREIINAKRERDLKVVCAIMNAGQLAFHNIAIDILEEERFNAIDIDKANDLESTINEHKLRRDLITAPSNTELDLVTRFLPRLPLNSSHCEYELDIFNIQVSLFVNILNE